MTTTRGSLQVGFASQHEPDGCALTPKRFLHDATPRFTVNACTRTSRVMDVISHPFVIVGILKLAVCAVLWLEFQLVPGAVQLLALVVFGLVM